MTCAVRLFGLLLLTVAPCVAAESVWSDPVGRQTSDRFSDLLDRLVADARFKEAKGLCEFMRRGLIPESDDSAKWAIRMSATLTAESMTKPQFDDPQIADAQQPITELLTAYPEHRRRLFLDAQLIRVQSEAAQHDVVELAVVPSTEQRIDQVLKRLSRGTTALLELAERVSDERAAIGSRQNNRLAFIDDLIRLEQELRVDAVSLALMQTELFDRGSRDRLAAATQTETIARQASTLLPADSTARREVRRIEIEAMIRGQHYDRAETALNMLVREMTSPVPAKIQAMLVRIDVATGQLKRAADRIAAYYEPSPRTAPRSLAMDLARLEYLLASDQRATDVGEWLDLIEQRGGRYARRRAEAISLARLRASGQTQTVDASLVAAQAEDWLRRGDPSRAGGLFAAAALAERDGARAIRQATQAAAALTQADQPARASEILAKVAKAHPKTADAAAIHLQSAVSYARSGAEDRGSRIESILEENLTEWPDSDHAPAARSWLIKLLTGTGRHLEAAEVATRLSEDEVSSKNLERAFRLWHTALQSLPPDSLAAPMTRFEEAFRQLPSTPESSAWFRSAAACLLDRSLLTELPPSELTETSAFHSACNRLLEFRRSPSGTIDAPPASLTEVASWRLMRDGSQYPQLRRPIALSLNGWPNGEDPSLAYAQRLIWLGRTGDAVTVLKKLAAESSTPGTRLREAAELLGGSDDLVAKRAAVDLWDELAVGTPKGSHAWHDAKIASIRLLHQLGKDDDAARRAAYILLTTPPSDDELKRQYESLSSP